MCICKDGHTLKYKITVHDNLSLTKQYQEEHIMLTKSARKVSYRNAVNPVILVETTPILALVDIVAAAHDGIEYFRK